MPHQAGSAPGYLVVRCNDFIDFQRVELWHFAENGSVDVAVPSMIGAMPTRLSCPARPVRTPDGRAVCLALSSLFEAGPASGKVGAACLRTNDAIVALDASFGAVSHFVFTPPALDPLPEQFTVRAYELAFGADGRLYEAFTAGSHSFVARIRADGSNVDEGFGDAGVVHVGQGDRPPWCLQVDARGRTFWNARRKGGVAPVLARRRPRRHVRRRRAARVRGRLCAPTLRARGRESTRHRRHHVSPGRRTFADARPVAQRRLTAPARAHLARVGSMLAKWPPRATGAFARPSRKQGARPSIGRRAATPPPVLPPRSAAHCHGAYAQEAARWTLS